MKTREMVVMTNEELHTMLNPLTALAQKEFPTKTAYNLSRSMTEVERAVKAVQKFRQELQEKYQKKDKKGEPVWEMTEGPDGKKIQKQPPTPVWKNDKAKEDYEKELEVLSEEESDFKAFRVFLSDMLTVNLKPQDLMGLEWLIIDDVYEEEEDEDEEEDEKPAPEPDKK